MPAPAVWLGYDPSKNRVSWEPAKQKNPHLLLVGTSGSGKSETLKVIIRELREERMPSLIVDFHNEFSDVAEQRVNLRELTINPLEIPAGRRPQDIIYEVADIVKKIFKLGDQQEAMLRDCIRTCYERRKIRVLDVGGGPAPGFLEVRDVIKDKLKSNRTTAMSLLSRIEPLFDVDIFKESTAIPFEDILSRSTTIELKDFPTEEVKSAIAEFFLSKLMYHLYGKGQRDLSMFCVIDEAHRLLYDQSPLDRLLRESRKYGAGVILSSQRPSDFSETVLANAGGIVCLQCNLMADAKFVGVQLGISPDDIKNLVRAGEGFVKFSADTASRRVQVVPLAGRMTPGEYQALRKRKAEPVSAAPPAERKEPHLPLSREEVVEGRKKADAAERQSRVSGLFDAFGVVVALAAALLVMFYSAWAAFAVFCAVLVWVPRLRAYTGGRNGVKLLSSGLLLLVALGFALAQPLLGAGALIALGVGLVYFGTRKQ